MSSKREPAELWEKLRKAGRLSDPVKILSFWILVATGLTVLTVGVSVGQTWVNVSRNLGQIGPLVLFIGAAAGLSLPLAMWLILKPATLEPVFYLRAFRSDSEAGHLRRLLKAALGPSLRLCGIRAPKERVSWISRLFLNASTGFRYIGSDRFELESADHNWMVRLLASYAQARFVFIDVRDITTHVANEIRLSYLAMGHDRSIFITDDRKTSAEWQKLIHELLGNISTTSPGFLLLEYVKEKESDEDFVNKTIQILQGIPEGQPDVSGALDFVKSHTPEKDWPTPIWEKDWGQLVIGWVATTLILLPLNAALGTAFGPTATIFPIGILLLIILFFHFQALKRSWAESGFQKKLKTVTRQTDPGQRARCAVFLTGFWVIVICGSLSAMPLLSRAKQNASEALCRNNMRQIGLSFKILAIDNDDHFPFNVPEEQGGTLEFCSIGPDGFDENSWRHFQTLSNELLGVTRLLVCPEDASKHPAADFQSLGPENVTYLLRTGTNITPDSEQEVLMFCPIHKLALYADGSIIRQR